MSSAQSRRRARAPRCAQRSVAARSPERERVDFERMRVQQRDDLVWSERRLRPMGSRCSPHPSGTLAERVRRTAASIGTGTVAGMATSTIPLESLPAATRVGKKMFDVYCAVCHGAGGFGGSIVAENMGAPRPPSLRTSARCCSVPDGYFFDVATHGTGRMPPYASQLTAEERWAVVAYLEAVAAHADHERRERSRTRCARSKSVRIDSAARLRRRP